MGPAAQRGWVRATTMNHQYADAQRRGNPITLLVTETTGAMSPTLCAALRETGKAVAPAHRVPKNGMLMSERRDESVGGVAAYMGPGRTDGWNEHQAMHARTLTTVDDTRRPSSTGPTAK